MGIRRFVLLLLLIALIALAKPLKVWDALRRAWDRRNLVLGTILFALAIYVLYGLYTLYTERLFESVF